MSISSLIAGLHTHKDPAMVRVGQAFTKIQQALDQQPSQEAVQQQICEKLDETIVDPLPSGSAGQEWVPCVTNFTALIEYGAGETGIQMWRVYGTYVPSEAPEFRGLHVIGRQSGKDTQMAFEPRQSVAYVSRWHPVPEAAQTWKFYACSAGVGDLVNSIKDGVTPCVERTIERQVGLGGLKLKYAVNFDLSEFEIDPTVGFRVKILNADKIQTGTLRVGGGGGKPGLFGVFDAWNNLVAWAGQVGPWYGLWGKQVWIGGNGPVDAPFFVDSSGNIKIETVGAHYPTFSLNLNGVTTKISNTLVGTVYAGLQIATNGTSRSTIVHPYGLWCYEAGGALTVTLDTTNAAGRLILANSTGAGAVNLQGSNGRAIFWDPASAQGIYLIPDAAGGGYISTPTEYRTGGVKVVGARGAAVADPTGGAFIDAEARAQLSVLLGRLRTHGLIAS